MRLRKGRTFGQCSRSIAGFRVRRNISLSACSPAPPILGGRCRTRYRTARPGIDSNTRRRRSRTLLDDADPLDSDIAQLRTNQQSAHTTTDYDDIDLVSHRVANKGGIRVGIMEISGKMSRYLRKLPIAVGP